MIDVSVRIKPLLPQCDLGDCSSLTYVTKSAT